MLGHRNLGDRISVRRRSRKIPIAERRRGFRVHVPILELKERLPIETQHHGAEQRNAGTQVEMSRRFFVGGNALRANCPGPMDSFASRDAIVDAPGFEQAGAASGATDAPAPEIKDPG